MKISLRTKITVAFLSVSVLLFVFIGILANYFLVRQFRDYTITKQEQKNKDIIALVSARYSDWGSKWDINGLETIGVNALGEGLILKVRDAGGIVLWDAKIHNNGMCTAILEQMAKNMQSVNPDFKGGYTESTGQLELNGIKIGEIDIGYYGPYFYTDLDVNFLNTLNRLLVLGTVIAILASIALGVFLSKQIADPIARVVKAAGKIAEGDYAGRIREKSGTMELTRLEDSINSLAETLASQEELRKRLSADVAHELRTPITTLKSHLEAMIDGTWKPESRRLESCHEEVVRMSKLVGDLETLTRYDKENMTLYPERFDASAVLRRVVTNFQSDFVKKSVALELTPVDSDVYLTADEDKISQVLVNLLSNALKYTPEGGKIVVSAYEKDSEVVFSVKDNGIGISKDDIPFIFERFYRTDKSRTRSTGGSGIGLAIVKSIVDAHNGKIRVESELDAGTEFIVTLPAGGVSSKAYAVIKSSRRA